MAGLHRRYIGAVVVLVVAFTALGTGAFFGALYAPNFSEISTYANQPPLARNHSTLESLHNRVVPLSSIGQAHASAVEPQTGDREKRELVAQEQSALWAFWMLVVSAVSAATTIVGTAILLWQVKLTREAVEDTSRATTAMESQNDLVAQQQRPWLTIEIKKPFISRSENGLLLVCEVHLENIGSTPAYDAAVDFCLGTSIRNPLPDFRTVAENVFKEGKCGDEWENLTVLPRGNASTQIFVWLDPDDPRHSFDDGIVPIFMAWANYKFGNGKLGHSSAQFSVSLQAEYGSQQLIPWDMEIDGTPQNLVIESLGYVLVQ